MERFVAGGVWAEAVEGVEDAPAAGERVNAGITVDGDGGMFGAIGIVAVDAFAHGTSVGQESLRRKRLRSGHGVR